mmetsp:Transcript_9479/g.16569  ORF Transcript_9479/g.16569 Transcript_9479/m.16569 type:complete len:84 (-) Transcript_9479:159-410(-)
MEMAKPERHGLLLRNSTSTQSSISLLSLDASLMAQRRSTDESLCGVDCTVAVVATESASSSMGRADPNCLSRNTGCFGESKLP